MKLSVKAFLTVLAITAYTASGVYIVKDEYEDYSEGYSGLVGEYAPLEAIGNKQAEQAIRNSVLHTLFTRGLEPASEDAPIEFTTLKYMRTTGSILKQNDNKELIFGGMANISTSDGGYAIVYIDHKGTSMIAAHVIGSAAAAENTGTESAADSGKLRVLSYNIWNYNGDWKQRTSLLCDEICSPNYDAVALQELRYESWPGEAGQGRLQIEHIAAECHMRGVDLSYVWQPAMMYPQHVQNNGEYEVEGVAVLSRHPILGVERRFLTRSIWDSEDAHQRVALAARIRIPAQKKDFTFISTHFSLSDKMELSNAQELANFAAELAAPTRWPGAVIAMGDFNAEPSSSAYAFITGNAGFADAWTTAPIRNGPENGFSWARVPGDPTTKRVDYCFFKNFGSNSPSSSLAAVEVSPVIAAIPQEFHCTQKAEGEEDEEEEDYYDENANHNKQEQQVKPRLICASDHLPLSVEFAIIEHTDTFTTNDNKDTAPTKEEL